MEKWDVLTEDGEKTGEVVIRSKRALKAGQYHMVVHIWLVDSQNRLLIQQRSYNLAILPGKWAATGGSAVSGEDELTAAKRELLEELGIDVSLSELELFKKYKGKNDFVSVYIVRKNISLCDIKMQQAEVEAVKWVSTTELLQMINEKKFHSYGYIQELCSYISK